MEKDNKNLPVADLAMLLQVSRPEVFKGCKTAAERFDVALKYLNLGISAEQKAKEKKKAEEKAKEETRITPEAAAELWKIVAAAASQNLNTCSVFNDAMWALREIQSLLRPHSSGAEPLGGFLTRVDKPSKEPSDIGAIPFPKSKGFLGDEACHRVFIVNLPSDIRDLLLNFGSNGLNVKALGEREAERTSPESCAEDGNSCVFFKVIPIIR